MPQTSSIRSAVSTEHRLVTDRQTDRHMDMAYTALAYRRACKIGIYFVLQSHLHCVMIFHMTSLVTWASARLNPAEAPTVGSRNLGLHCKLSRLCTLSC